MTARAVRTAGASAPAYHPPFLVTRREAARLLSVDVSTIRRLERDGKLTPIRFNKKGRVYYAYDEVLALAKGGDE